MTFVIYAHGFVFLCYDGNGDFMDMIDDIAQAHYVLDLCAFAEMFAGEQFTVWTRRGEEEICEEKDAEYYSWTHK